MYQRFFHTSSFELESNFVGLHGFTNEKNTVIKIKIIFCWNEASSTQQITKKQESKTTEKRKLGVLCKFLFIAEIVTIKNFTISSPESLQNFTIKTQFRKDTVHVRGRKEKHQQR